MGFRLRLFALLVAFAAFAPTLALAQPPTPPSQAPPQTSPFQQTPQSDELELESLNSAFIRLPLAAVLGTVLALRPKRRGTPARQTAVVQTQIILSVVGAVIMLVVGASLARAFGIVGAANLIRYRSKIEDPKDAVVMLCALSVGLASGVGLYLLAVFSTGFLAVALWIIESFEPQQTKAFKLNVKAGDAAEELRPKIEAILRRHELKWELRTISDDQVSYVVTVPSGMKTDPLAKAIAALDSRDIFVEWDEAKSKKKDS